MMFETVDPSHLFALHVLLEEGNVTRAAEKLGITQSSMSHRLARLRDALGDPLFVRQGQRLVPTQLATSIREPLKLALRALDAAIAPAADFDPAKSGFKLQLFLPDVLGALLPSLVHTMMKTTPGVDVEAPAFPNDLDRALDSAECSVAFAPHHFASSHLMTRSVGELQFGVFGRRDHPALVRSLTTHAWLAYPHVVVSIGNQAPNLLEQHLKQAGLARRVGLVVPSFLMGLLAVSRSDLLINAPAALVSEARQALGLTWRAAPIRLPSVRLSMVWHARFNQDPAHKWVREQLHSRIKVIFSKAP